jgi:hypothetical protein
MAQMRVRLFRRSMADRIYVGTRKGLVVIDPRKNEVTDVAFLGVQVPMLLPDPRTAGRVYAAVGHGHFGCKLHRSDDHGKTWTEITAPKFPPKPPEVPDTLCPMRKIVIPWNVELIWSLEAGGADEPGELWLGTIPGGLFHSLDHGSSWQLVDSLWNHPDRAKWMGGGYDYPGIHSIFVDPRPGKSGHVTIAISCGGVWVTEDRGKTWRQSAHGMRNAYLPAEHAYIADTADAHRLVGCASNPDVMWVQHHNGIFRTVDGSRTWTEHPPQPNPPAIPGSKLPGERFGFAVAVHPRKPDTAWFVPAIKDEQRVPINGALSVTRTTDGGKTFHELRSGLPQKHAYDLVYRHGLDVDATGDKLAMGSTTGSLWLSDDAGDHWRTVSSNLPPIFCVRFG